MKFSIFFLCQIICLQSLFTQHNVRVYGKINQPIEQKVYIRYYKDFISYQQVIADSALLNEEGEFSMTFSIKKPVYAEFYHGNERGKLFINVNDNLKLEVDGQKFDESLKFTGANAHINNYLAKKTLKFPKESLYNIYKMPEKEFLKFIDSLQMVQLSLYNEYFFGVENKNASTKTFMELEMVDILYQFFEIKLNYHNFYSFVNNLEKPIVPDSSYYEFLNEVSFENENALNSISFVLFLESYTDDEVSKIYKKDTTQKLIDIKEHYIESHFTVEIKSFSYAKWAYNLLQRNADYLNGKRIVEKYKMSSKDNTYDSVLDQELAEAARLAVGNAAPDFTYPDINGKLVTLSNFLGKVVYIDIWASWCLPCLHQIPFAKDLENKLHDEEIVFLYVSVDESEDAWLKMVMEKELKGIHLISKVNFTSDIRTLYNVKGVPKYLIIDKQGNIADNNAKRPSQNVYLDLISILGR